MESVGSLEGTADLSQNCHGYAFGVEDWPDDDMYGADVLLEADTCYENCMSDTAELASNGSHSIKVTGDECQDACSAFEILDSTIEKFRASRIYKQNNGCNAGVNVSKAHNNVTFSLYKKK